MKDFSLQEIQGLAAEALKEEPTGDQFLDARYQEQVGIVGHTQPYYRLFYRLAQSLEPDFTVELGSWQATAAAHFASGWPQGMVVTIDHHKDDKAAQVRAFEAALHYKNLDYIPGWTWDVVDEVRRYGKPIDVMFIDSWHDKQYLDKEWALYGPLLADTALVICDDVMPGDSSIGFGTDEFFASLPGKRFLDDRVHPGVPMGFLKFARRKET